MDPKIPDSNPETVKPQPIKLPFDNRKEDLGMWTYDHRIGLCVTLIAYLLLMIAFVTAKIVVGMDDRQPKEMFIDMQTLAMLEAERDRLEEEVQLRREQEDPFDWGSVKNRVSNENAENAESRNAGGGGGADGAGANARLRDDRGTDVGALNSEAGEVAARMRANREAYEKGLAEERAIGERRGSGKGGDSENQDAKVKGNVTVSFSLGNPVRTMRQKNIPAYKCEHGGVVELEITVNRSGDVTNAKVLSGGDECMRESALSSAYDWKFNIDGSAPAAQKGTMTYVFIPQ